MYYHPKSEENQGMSFLHNSLSRAWGPRKLSSVLPGCDGQNRKVQRDSVAPGRPEYSNLRSTKPDVLDDRPPPIVQQVASSALLSFSNTLRSKARIFYADSIKADMEMPGKTAAEETPAIRSSSRSYTSARSQGDNHKDQHDFLELTASSPWKYKDTPSRSNANSRKLFPIEDEYTDGGFPAYLEPFNFECFHPKDLDFTSDDDCKPAQSDNGASGDESPDHESFKLFSNHHAFDYRSLNFSPYRGDDSGSTKHGPWDLKPSEGSHSTYNVSELSESPSSSMSNEGNFLTASKKAYHTYMTDSERSSSSCSGSLSTEAQYPLVEARTTSHSQHRITKSMEDIDTCSEHEADHMTELTRFPDCFKYRTNDSGEVGCKIGLPIIETQSIGRDSYSPERPFNAAKLPQFNAISSGTRLAQPSLRTVSERWVLPPLAIPHATDSIYETLNFTSCEGFDDTTTLIDKNAMMDFIPSTQLSRGDV